MTQEVAEVVTEEEKVAEKVSEEIIDVVGNDERE